MVGLGKDEPGRSCRTAEPLSPGGVSRGFEQHSCELAHAAAPACAAAGVRVGERGEEPIKERRPQPIKERGRQPIIDTAIKVSPPRLRWARSLEPVVPPARHP